MEEKKTRIRKRDVIKRAWKYICDDIDPIKDGVKGAAYTLHGIPTWKRECDEGTMGYHNGWTAVTYAFTMGAQAVGYFAAINAAENMTDNSGYGYAMLGIPIISQGSSYVAEKFRKAKKDLKVEAGLEKKLEQEWKVILLS